MVDYTKPTGSGGTMMIRDLGSTVEYWIKAGSTNTWFASAPYSWYYNGSSGSGTFSYSTGAQWKKIRSFTVTTSQTVQFNIGDTGTSGIGGPTNFSQFLNRTSVPSPPTIGTISSITGSSASVPFTDGANNGASITSRQVARNTSNTTAGATIITSNSPASLTGLAADTTYYVWARTYNSVGWSGWSPAKSFKTARRPYAPTITSAVLNPDLSVTITYTDGSNGGMPVTSRTVGFGTSESTPISTQLHTGNTFTVAAISLTPGYKNYFWVRTNNAVGNGDWSARVSLDILGVIRVKVAGVWKYATPYVKVAGVWKVAVPYVKVSGVWKNTS